MAKGIELGYQSSATLLEQRFFLGATPVPFESFAAAATAGAIPSGELAGRARQRKRLSLSAEKEEAQSSALASRLPAPITPVQALV